MAYGFEATNNNGKVIINDTIENLHFLGKASRGSASSGFGTIPNYSGANTALDGRVIHLYTITCTGTPLAFIKPTDYARWHGLIKQSVSSTTWTFEVMISGTSTSNPPVLYCFVNANNAPSSSESYGMQVFKANGSTKTFDSRKQPLAITGGKTALAPPSDPTDSSGTPGTTDGHAWNHATNDHDFRSHTRYNTTSDSSINTSTTMFACSSLAQGVYKRQMEGHKFSETCVNLLIGTFCFNGQHHYSTALWYVMYRQAFRLRAGNFDSGWNGYAAGYAFSSAAEDGGWFGNTNTTYNTGSLPYTPKTINSQNSSYIIADSSRYN